MKEHPSFLFKERQERKKERESTLCCLNQFQFKFPKINCQTHSRNFIAMILYHEPSLSVKLLTYQPQSQSWGSGCWSAGWGWRRRWRSCSPSQSCYPPPQWRSAIRQLPEMIKHSVPWNQCTDRNWIIMLVKVIEELTFKISVVGITPWKGSNLKPSPKKTSCALWTYRRRSAFQLHVTDVNHVAALAANSNRGVGTEAEAFYRQ